MRFSQPAVGIVFDLDLLEWGANAIKLFMKHTDPRRLPNCMIASGDVRRSQPEVVGNQFDYCVAISGADAPVAYVREVFATLNIPGLAPPGRRVVEQPVLDRLGLAEDGLVDGHGRLVVQEWNRIDHDRCKDTGWGYAPREVNYHLSAELRAELDELRRPQTRETTAADRHVCSKCGTSFAERVAWWRAPSPAGVVKVGGDNLGSLFLYCQNCQKAICGGCSIDLGMSSGCPFCRAEARELTHHEIQTLLGQERIL